MIRPIFTLVHRWTGLLIAGFLFVSGLTGAVISWDRELDVWLNGHLLEAQTVGSDRASLDLAHEIEVRHPKAEVTYIPLAAVRGRALTFDVSARLNPDTGQNYDLDFNQVFVDPVSGEELGRRSWGVVWPITSENFVSFLYVLHYSLHLPAPFGVLLMGVIALIWTVDCFVGFYLTLPTRTVRKHNVDTSRRTKLKVWWSRWVISWRIKRSGSTFRLNFDIHRAFGLWTWILLFVLAFTAFSLNLYSVVFYPVMSTVSEVTPLPFDTRTPTDEGNPIKPKLKFVDIIQMAKAEAKDRGWTVPMGDIFYAHHFGVYGVRFFEPGGDYGTTGVGPAALYYDGLDGQALGSRVPWQGTAADIFVQAQFPVHSGRILGLPGRILISIMGIVVTALSVTGVVIWWKKRTVRVRRKTQRIRKPASLVVE